MADPGTCDDCITAAEPVKVETTDRQPEDQAQDQTMPPQNPLDPATFIPPSPLPLPSITIEFCDRVRALYFD